MLSNLQIDLKGSPVHIPRILIVDDEPEIRAELGEMLVDEGLDVVSAGAADEALALVETDPDIGIVFTDLRMPGMGGMEFAEKLQGACADQRPMATVIITGHGGMDEAVKALNHGVADFVTKPFEWDRTEAALTRAVERWRDAAEGMRLTEHLHETVDSQNSEIERLCTRLAEQNLALEAANRAKTHFLQNMGHELKTPLQYLQGALGVLGETAPATGRRSGSDEWIGLMRDASAQLARHVDSLLALSEVDGTGAAVRRVHFDPARACSDVIDLYCRKASARGQTLFLEPSALPVHAYADRNRFLFALGLVVDNAVRHCPPDARIEVRLQMDLMETGWTTVQVIDNGPGVEPEVIDKAFSPLREIHQGLRSDVRLGLYLARRSMRVNGGDLGVRHPSSGGLQVDLHLPLGGDLS